MSPESRDNMRSILIAQHLGAGREIALIRHTGCGGLTFTTDQIREKLVSRAPGSAEVANEAAKIDFLEFSNIEKAIRENIDFLKNHPLVLKETLITGWVYEVETGKVRSFSLVPIPCRCSPSWF
jgi:carbonic anhydrase